MRKVDPTGHMNLLTKARPGVSAGGGDGVGSICEAPRDVRRLSDDSFGQALDTAN